METLKILSIFGTRPEAIKMAPLVRTLKETPGVESRLCVTAQHREMLDQVLNLFNLVPQEDLNIMKDRQTLSGITCRALEGLEEIILKDKPHLVLVHGDTTTTFAASLAAYYQQVKVGHVEAGLRTFQKYSPFPEEMNRKLAGALADLHFAPTRGAAQNLLEEGVDPQSIFVTGNTVIDALQTTVGEDHLFEEEKLNHLDYENQRVILVEAHRRENLGRPLEEICQALADLVDNFPDTCLVFPVHKNPAVRETVSRFLGDKDRVYLLEPLATGDFHNLMARSYLILTDSGGIQEEAPSLGKPVLVLREHTERPEAVERGTVRLVGRDRERVYRGGAQLLQDGEDYLSMARAVNPYGDGKASPRIRDILLHSFGFSSQLPPPFNP